MALNWSKLRLTNPTSLSDQLNMLGDFTGIDALNSAGSFVSELPRKLFNSIPGVGKTYVSSDSLPNQADLYDENYYRTLALMEKQEEFQRVANASAMDFNAEQAKIAREFSRELSDTAWQRAVSDMKKAGLNPALAYSQGPASTPGAASASGVSSSGASGSLSDTGYQYYNNLHDMFTTLINSATSIMKSFINGENAVNAASVTRKTQRIR